jgi:hypothetical protein
MRMGQLVEPDSGHTFSLGFEPVSMGRHDDNTIVLPDPEVSRHHAEIALQGGRWVISDLGSANGTYINEQRTVGPQVLNHGDTIRVGQSRFRVEIPAALAAQDTLVERLRPEDVLPARRPVPLLTVGLIAAAAVIAFLAGLLLVWFLLHGGKEVAQNTAEVPGASAMPGSATVEPAISPTTTRPPSKPTATALPTIAPPTAEPSLPPPTAAPPPATRTPAPTPAIGYFRAESTTITPGRCTRLEWGQMENVNSITLTDMGRVNPTGKLDVCLDTTKAYTLKAIGSGGTAEKSIQITVQPSPGPAIEYFRVVPSIIRPGDCAQLEWGKVENATSATIVPDIGGVATPGSLKVCPDSTTIYVLTAQDPEGTRTAYATLIVSSQTDQMPVIAFFTAAPASIRAGECTTLSWGKVDYAAEVTIDNGIGGVATPGSREICPGKATTYVMTAVGPGGTTESRLTVNVLAAPPPSLPDLVIESILFEPNPCYWGQSCKVQVKVRNDGAVDAGHFVVRWAPAGEEVVPVEWDVGGLNAGQDKVLKYIWIPSQANEAWSTSATVDVYDEVVEIEEGVANTLEKTITVR